MFDILLLLLKKLNPLAVFFLPMANHMLLTNERTAMGEVRAWQPLSSNATKMHLQQATQYEQSYGNRMSTKTAVQKASHRQAKRRKLSSCVTAIAKLDLIHGTRNTSR